MCLSSTTLEKTGHTVLATQGPHTHTHTHIYTHTHTHTHIYTHTHTHTYTHTADGNHNFHCRRKEMQLRTARGKNLLVLDLIWKYQYKLVILKTMYFLALSTKGIGSNNSPATVSTPGARSWFLNTISHSKKPSSSRKWLIPGLRQRKYKVFLEQFVPKNNKALKG